MRGDGYEDQVLELSRLQHLYLPPHRAAGAEKTC